MDKATREKIDQIHDFVIRMESVCEDVRSLKRWRDGNGWPGVKTQVYILWGAFTVIGAIAIRALAK